jgi:hypothetical protein
MMDFPNHEIDKYQNQPELFRFIIPQSLMSLEQVASSPINEIVERLCQKFSVSHKVADEIQSAAALSKPISAEEDCSSGVNVSLTSDVSTFIVKSRKALYNYLVPAFASHWAIVCDFRGDGNGHLKNERFLYHLVYDTEIKKVEFMIETWKRQWDIHAIKQVGITKYKYHEIKEIGMIKSLYLLMIKVSD